MNSKLSFILLLLLYNGAYCFCLKSTEICKKTHIKCEANLNRHEKEYSITCVKSICHGVQNHQCGPEYCTTNKESCEDFRNLNIFISLFNRGLGFLYETQINQFKAFLNHIHLCPNKITNVKRSDVCIRAKNCFYKKKMPFRTRNAYLVKQKSCDCPISLPINCHDFHCVANKSICEEIPRENFKLLKIIECE